MTGRGLRHPRLVIPALAWALLLALGPAGGEAVPLAPVTTDVADPAELEARLIVAHLVALGVSPRDARASLARLTDAERQALAQRLDEVGSGGSIAAVLAIGIIVGLLAVLVLELIGRRVVSRPSEP
jgi:hypothetical protein